MLNPSLAMPPSTFAPSIPGAAQGKAAAALTPENKKAKEVFNDFVGQTFYGQMLKAMRSTVDKPAYFHGGRAEEMFQSQLDQTMAEQLAAASGETFGGPMFENFLTNLSHQSRG